MPAISQIENCNKALVELPASKVIALDENSLEARECRAAYAQVLGELLELGNWTAARKQIGLAQLATNDRSPVWTYAYAIPADMVMPVRLLPPYDTSLSGAVLLDGQRVAVPISTGDDPGVSFDTAGNVLYSNMDGGVLEYVQASPEFSSFLFARALQLALAARICMPITKSTDKKRQLLAEAELALQRALASNANSRPQSYGDFVPDAVKAMWGEYG